MLNLFLAEWKKIVKNAALTSFLVWVIPVGTAAFFAIALVVGLFSKTAMRYMAATSPGQWTDDMLGVWGLLTSFPVNVFGRMLPLAFMAVVFTGEYQWGVWKNLVPRRSRVALIIVKFVALAAVVMLSLVLTSLITAVGQWLAHRSEGMAYGPALTWPALRDFARAYGQSALLGLIALLILAGFAAVSATVTRSMLPSMLAGFGFSVFEAMALLMLILLGGVFDNPRLVNLYRFTPSYNIDNAQAWFATHAPLALGMGDFTAQHTLATSLVILTCWIIGLGIAAAILFQRQDITS